jgi:hypothetical protein
VGGVELLIKRATRLEAAASSNLVSLLRSNLLVKRALTDTHGFKVFALVLHRVLRELRSERISLDFGAFTTLVLQLLLFTAF